MSGCEDTDCFWATWTSPGKRRRKKDKACVKYKNGTTIKTNEHTQKKKKKKKSQNPKFKEAMEERKEKKKERRKKTKSLQGLDDAFISTQGHSGASVLNAKLKPETADPHRAEQPGHMTQDSKKKTKRKKKVSFDLAPGCIRVKRPKRISPSPKELLVSDNKSVRDSNSCSQAAVTGHTQAEPFNNDSQCTSDDINSQDLFITQKTFRTVLSEPSSGEASDQALKALSSVVQMKHHQGSNIHPHGSRFQLVPTEEHKKDFHLAEHPKRQMQLNTNLMEETAVSGVVNPYLDEAVREKPKKVSSSLTQQRSSRLLSTDKHSQLPSKSTANISTQTENFFTTELSYYLSFCQKTRVTVCFDALKPLDLSLPQRARKAPERSLLVNMSGNEVRVAEEKLSDQKPTSLPQQTRATDHADPSLQPSCSGQIKDVVVKKDPAAQQLPSVDARCKNESPLSERGTKSADTTSSEDSEAAGCTGKLDLIQVRAVQMRLNESFFFKTKGEGQSPRPQSPLMKLVQSRDTKSRKGH